MSKHGAATKECPKAIIVTIGLGDAGLRVSLGFDPISDQFLEIMNNGGIMRSPCKWVVRSLEHRKSDHFQREWESRRAMCQLLWRAQQFLHTLKEILEARTTNKGTSRTGGQRKAFASASLHNTYEVANASEVKAGAHSRFSQQSQATGNPSKIGAPNTILLNPERVAAEVQEADREVAAVTSLSHEESKLTDDASPSLTYAFLKAQYPQPGGVGTMLKTRPVISSGYDRKMVMQWEDRYSAGGRICQIPESTAVGPVAELHVCSMHRQRQIYRFSKSKPRHWVHRENTKSVCTGKGSRLGPMGTGQAGLRVDHYLRGRNPIHASSQAQE